MSNTKIYEDITERILDSMKQGVLPWKRGWDATVGLPRNRFTKRLYSGINVWLLEWARISKGYESNEWLTFNQAKENDGFVRKGEKSTPVIFAKMVKVKNKDTEEDEETKTFFMYKYYFLFNVAQCDNIEASKDSQVIKTPNEVIESAQAIVEGYKDIPTIVTQGNPCYIPSLDEVWLPSMDTFDSSEEYYSTLFHELVHSTGHPSRLNRELNGKVAKTSYSKEELVAEFGASYLSGISGISSDKMIDNSASYIDGWASVFKKDPKIIVQSASLATRACNYILGE